MSTLYDVLSVSPSATQEEIRTAYHAAVRRTHPDKGGAVADFRRVQDAWAALGDPVSRAAYDRSLEPKRAEPRGNPAETADVLIDLARKMGFLKPEESAHAKKAARSLTDLLDALRRR